MVSNPERGIAADSDNWLWLKSTRSSGHTPSRTHSVALSTHPPPSPGQVILGGGLRLGVDGG